MASKIPVTRWEKEFYIIIGALLTIGFILGWAANTAYRYISFLSWWVG